MKKATLALIVTSALSLGLKAQNPWSDSVTVGTPNPGGSIAQTRFYYWSPASAQTNPQGVVVVSGFGTGRRFADSSTFRLYADSLRMPIVMMRGVASDSGLVTTYVNQASLDSLNKAITRLQVRANRSDLLGAIRFYYAHGHAVNATQGLTAANRTGTIGLVSNHASAQQLSAGAGVQTLTSHMAINGHTEGPETSNNANNFVIRGIRGAVFSAGGALITQVTEMNGSYNSLTNKTVRLIGTWLRELVAASRTPGGISFSNGVLIRQAASNNFSAQGIGAVAGPTPGDTLSWAPTGSFANAYIAFMVTPYSTPGFDRVFGPNPNDVSTGFRAGGMANVIADARTTFGANNILRLEISDVFGDFHNPMRPARVIGVDTTNRAVIDSINNAVFPDNEQDFVSPTSINRYRVRIVATNPNIESPASSEIRFVSRVVPYALVVSPELSARREFQAGVDSVTVNIRRSANGQMTFVPNTATVRLYMWGSDPMSASGSTSTIINRRRRELQANALLIGTFNNVDLTQGVVTTLKAAIPAGSYTGRRYTVRATAFNGTDTSLASSNGGFLTVNGRINNTQRFVGTKTQQVNLYPNPTADGRFNIQLGDSYAGAVSIRIMDLTGKIVETLTASTDNNNEVAVSPRNLTQGAYIVEVNYPGHRSMSRLVY